MLFSVGSLPFGELGETRPSMRQFDQLITDVRMNRLFGEPEALSALLFVVLRQLGARPPRSARRSSVVVLRLCEQSAPPNAPPISGGRQSRERAFRFQTKAAGSASA